MPIEVNNQNLFQSAQFQQFVDFAEAAARAGKQKAVARVDPGEVGGIANRTIIPGKGDWVGIGAGRLASLKQANNTTRDAFMEAVADMFGGADSIPDNVKDAMKMQDYGKGKPLTARRILAVKAAIDSVKAAIDSVKDTSSQATEKTNDYIQQGQEKLSGKAKLHAQGDVNKLIELAYKECQGNSDALDIVKSRLKSFVASGDDKIRTEAYVKERVGGLVDNLKELKALSVNNPAIYEVGTALLQTLGKPFPPGTITRMVTCANEASFKDLTKLSGSTSGMAMHTAIVQTAKSIDDILSSSGAREKLDGAEEINPARNFVLNVMFSRFSKAALVNIGNAISSEKTGHLQKYYLTCENPDKPLFPNESAEVNEGTKSVGTIGSTSLNRILLSLSIALDRLDPDFPQFEVQDVEGESDIDRLGGDKLLQATVSQAKEINEHNTQVYLDGKVAGSGKGADALKQVIRNKFGGAVNNPMETLGKRMIANANAMINWQICAEMKKCVTGETTYFEGDIDRRLNVTLTDGKKTFKLTNNFDTARDELARFVTGDGNATYKSISQPDRNKVNVLTSLLSQEFEKVGEDGVGYALDKREGEQAFTMSPDKTRPASRTFSIEKTRSGGISLTYDLEKPIKTISTDDVDDIDLGPGSTYKAHFTYGLHGTEFNRIANDVDYSKFDDTEAYKLFNRMQDMPDGTRMYAEQKNIKGVDTFAQEFKIRGQCEADFYMDLQPSDEDLIEAQRQ